MKRALSHRVSAAVITIGLGLAMGFVQASPVGAATATPTLLCTGTQRAHFAPPLSPIPHPTTISLHEDYGPPGGGTCAGVSEGQGNATANPPLASCAAGVPLPGADVFRYVFDGSEHLELEVTYTVTETVRVGAQTIVTSAGTVTRGDLRGRAVQREVILPSAEIDKCLQSHLSDITGIAEITIV